MQLLTEQRTAFRSLLKYPRAILIFSVLMALGCSALFWEWVPFLNTFVLSFPALLAGYGFMFYRSLRILPNDGRRIAEALGARPFPSSALSVEELRARNIVTEMALASGLPEPPLYILEGEPGVNAFTAGSDVENAVIGVTRGALTKLNREELQAMLAHALGRIRNEDLMLDIRMAQFAFAFQLPGLYASLQFCMIAALIVLCGLGLLGATLLTVLFGKDSSALVDIIQVACLVPLTLSGMFLFFWMLSVLVGYVLNLNITEERELAADVTAMEFTRSWALAATLATITRLEGNSRLLRKRAIPNHHNTEEISEPTLTPKQQHFSHIFFCPPGGLGRGEYPHIRKRIRRIDPAWKGKLGPAAKNASKKRMHAAEPE